MRASTFLIESPKLVRIATDYNDYVKPSVLPDIVTMNRAHSTHYTDRPEPGIKFVLRGWKDDGRPTDHDVNFQDVRVRSVATNIRDYGGWHTAARQLDLHLRGRESLHRASRPPASHPDPAAIERDRPRRRGAGAGRRLLHADLEGMIEVLVSLKAPLMIPMHFFSTYTLNRFMERISKDWDVETSVVPSVVLSNTHCRQNRNSWCCQAVRS